MKIAVVNMRSGLDKQLNLKKHISFVEQAADQGVSLLVFPELSLNGYLWDIQRNPPPKEAEYFLREAEPVPGPSSSELAEQAGKRDMFLIFGMAEECGGGLVCDSSVLVGPGGTLAVHRKVHLIGDESHIFRAGDRWQVWRLPFARLGMMVCYDKVFPEGPRELALGGADILVSISAWAIAGDKPEGDFLGGLFDLYDRVRASENQCWFISTNQVGAGPQSPKLFYGSSKIVDPFGRVVVQAGFEEGMVSAELDIKAGVLKGRTRGVYVGTNLLKDRRPDSYRRIASNPLNSED